MAKHDPRLDGLFKALADTTRRDMIERLAQGPARVSDLAGPTGMAMPTVMRHLSVLEDCGLVETEKSGRSRICRMAPDAMTEARDWMDDQRRIWEARLDRMEAYVFGKEPDNDH